MFHFEFEIQKAFQEKDHYNWKNKLLFSRIEICIWDLKFRHIMSTVSFVRSCSALGVLWEANMLSEIIHVWGNENKHKRENAIFFSRSWLIQTLRGALREEF